MTFWALCIHTYRRGTCIHIDRKRSMKAHFTIPSPYNSDYQRFLSDNVVLHTPPQIRNTNSIPTINTPTVSLKFMGPCMVSIFWYTCISKKMQRYSVYLFLETALHVSGGISAHQQEHTQLYLQHLVLVTPLLLSAAIAAGSSNGLTSTRCYRYSCVCSCWWAEMPPETCRAVSRNK